MTKIFCILATLSASLFFMMAFKNYDDSETLTRRFPFRLQILEEDYVEFSLDAVTETYRHGDAQFVRDVLNFYDSLPYNGYIINREAHNPSKGRFGTDATVYISNKTNYPFLDKTFSKPIDWDAFNAKSNTSFITDDLTDVSALAHMLPFSKFDLKGNGNLVREKTVYRNIHTFDIVNRRDKNHVFLLYFLIPRAEVDAFKTHLESSFVMPNYHCKSDNKSKQWHICNMAFSKNEKEYDQDAINFRLYNLLNNPLDFPKPILILTLATGFYVMILIAFKEQKEIAVRRLSGNREWLIMRRIFMPIMYRFLFVFNGTLAAFALIMLDFRHRATPDFVKVIVNIGMVMAVGFTITVLFFALVMKLFLRERALKQGNDQPFVLGFAVFTKLGVVVIVTVYVFTICGSIFVTQAVINEYNQKPFLKEQDTICVNYGNRKSAGEVREFERWLFYRVEDYKLEFISEDAITTYYEDLETKDSKFSYLVMNRAALKNRDIYDLNNDKIDSNRLKRNTLLVPQHNREKFDKYGFASDTAVIDVLETPDIISFIYPLAPIRNAPLLIVVDNPDPYVGGISRYGVHMSDNFKYSQALVDEITQKIGPVTTQSSESVYNRIKEEWSRQAFALFTISFGGITMILIFSAVLITTYFANKRHVLAIAYMQGKGRYERYRFIMLLTLLSTNSLAFVLFIVSMRTAPLFSILVQYQPYWILSIVTLLGDATLMGQALKRFEGHAIQNVLKGGS